MLRRLGLGWLCVFAEGHSCQGECDWRGRGGSFDERRTQGRHSGGFFRRLDGWVVVVLTHFGVVKDDYLCLFDSDSTIFD